MRSETYVEAEYDNEIDELLTELASDPNRRKHMELLADAFFDYLQRDCTEFGGWGLDSKRPFGNSFVEPDIAEICGFDRDSVYDDDGDEDEGFCEYLRSLYADLGVYLRYRWLSLKTTAVNAGAE